MNREEALRALTTRLKAMTIRAAFHAENCEALSHAGTIELNRRSMNELCGEVEQQRVFFRAAPVDALAKWRLNKAA